MKRETFRLSGRLGSIGHAARGIRIMLQTQHNARIHALATMTVLFLGWWADVSSMQWCWLLVAMVVVWMAELLNTALELLADAAFPEFHPLVKQAKDVSAGAVLIAATGAAIIGFIVLGPRLWNMFF